MRWMGGVTLARLVQQGGWRCACATAMLIARAARMGRLTRRRLGTLRRALDRDWDRIDIIAVEETHVRRAGDLAERFALRGYDSVHLAAAEAAMLSLGTRADFRLLVFDSAMAAGASALGLPLLPSAQ